MRQIRLMIAALLVISPFVARADPIVYEFSFDSVIGTVAGTVHGIIGFDFLASSTDSGTGAASFIEILSAPLGIPISIEGDVVTDWMTQAMNTFTIASGVITDYQFGASEGAMPAATDNVFCLNNGGFFFVGGVYYCGAAENYFGDGFGYVYNVGGINAVEIQQVPEPGTLALLGIGLFGMGLARRNKKA